MTDRREFLRDVGLISVGAAAGLTGGGIGYWFSRSLEEGETDETWPTTGAPDSSGEPAEPESELSESRNTDTVDTDEFDGSWEIGPGLPYPAQYPAVAAYQDELYVFGGSDGDNEAQPDAARYDPATESWSMLEPMPVPVRRTSASVVNDRIFLIDGSTPEESHGDGTVRIYDPDADSWSLGTNRPVTARDPGQATDGENIYVFGGNSGGMSQSYAHVYDPVGDSWTELSPLPFPNRQFSCHYLPNQERVYMFGGESPASDSERNDVLTYDPAVDRYDPFPSDMPDPSQTLASTVYQDTVLFAGGEEPNATTGMRRFQIYDPENDAWGTLPELIHMVEATDAAVIDGALYIPAGRTYFEPDADLDAEPHQYRYDDFPVFHDRMQVYRFDS